MKKQVLISVCSFLFLFNSFALEVNKSELQSANDSNTIEFINYTGPHKFINSIKEIKGIGSVLGKTVSSDITKSAVSGAKNRYYVIHAVDETSGKLDADILFLGENASVDHIDNLRRIISGYLTEAYGYSEKDADTLAVFITVYNAVYRGNFDVFSSKYKDVVLRNLSKDNCGLSVNYKDWPGKSEIVIPLFDLKNGGLSTVDTSVISDTKVVESMKEDDDKNIESRKEMVDIKERESDEASEKAKESQKTAVEEQKKAKEEEVKTEQAKEELKEAEKTADEKQKIADENPDDKEAQVTAEKAEEKAEEAEKTAEEKEEALQDQKQKEQEQQDKVEQAKEEAKNQQAVADKKQNEAQSERKEIAKDQQIVQKEEARKAEAPYSYGIILTDEKAVLSRLVKFNTDNGDILKSSPVTVIRNRTIFQTSEGFIAIAGENTGKGTVKLVILDSDNMEMIKESDFTVADNSVLVQDGTDYYCIISENKKFYVVKADENLSIRLKSQIEVKESTPVTVSDKGIVVTDSTGKLKLLSKDSLSELSKK